ncbi:MAG: hypothetical protein QX197_15915 [Methylococcaceae bacterium]
MLNPAPISRYKYTLGIANLPPVVYAITPPIRFSLTSRSRYRR